MSERLTKRDENGNAYYDWGCLNRNHWALGRHVDRLAAYEDSGLSPEEAQELAKAKADGRVVVLCPKCKYAGFSKTTAYAYVCKNRLSPCRDRTTTSDFGCVYGQKKEIEADV